MQGNQKKRHHYVPVTYLNRFADMNGRIFAYRKDCPLNPLHVRPKEIAFERYYYSQQMPSGDQDNNRLEDLFSQVETYWPSLVDDLTARRNIHDRTEALLNFVSLLRVRGPAARDAAELLLANMVRRQMQSMIDTGEVSALPANVSFDDINIAIDPHQSIHAMGEMLKGLAQLWEHVGLEVVHNTTSQPFATSDNPMIYFDPDVPEDRILPYNVQMGRRRIELLLPISPSVMLRGRTEIPVVRAGERLRHVDMTSRSEVCRVNRFTARFGYRFVFATHGGLEALVSKHASLSPTVRFDVLTDKKEREYTFSQMVFGRRPQKPKWRVGD